MQLLVIAGNVGKDAVLRRTQGGEPVLGFSLAVDNGKDKSGNKRESTWYDCAIWGKRAEALQGYVTKGQRLTLQGRPTTRAHEGKAYLGISVSELTFQSSKPQGSTQPADQGGYGGDAGGYGGGGQPPVDTGDEISF